MKHWITLLICTFIGMFIGSWIAHSGNDPKPLPARLDIAQVGGCTYLIAVRGEQSISIVHHAACTNHVRMQ